MELIRRRLSKHSLKDTFEFIDHIKEINLTDRHLFSMDVISLYTNVPIREVVNLICDIQENLPIPEDSFCTLLFLCTKVIQFQFNGQMYKQIDGVAMGSSLGPLFAFILMSHLAQSFLNEYIAQTSFYKRYVDDTFIVCNKIADAELLLNKFNESHPNIKFTLEHEENGRIHFLDVMIDISGGGSIKRSVYRKSFWNKQYLHFRSSVPVTYKVFLTKTLINRAKLICSKDLLETELNNIKEGLSNNGYPG